MSDQKGSLSSCDPVGAAHADECADLHRLLVDGVSDHAIFALDTQGNILSWNSGAERITGLTAAEAIGQPLSTFYPPESLAEGFPEIELRAALDNGRFECEGWRVRKDGSRFWASTVVTTLRDDTGRVIGFARVARDLTRSHQAETALRQSEEGFRLLVQGVKDYAIFMLDPTGRVVTWNEGAERIKGYRPKEIIGKSFSTFYAAEEVASGKPQRELEIASCEGTYSEEGWRVRKDGTTFWASVLITALHNRAGELVGFSKVTRDLTERRAAEERALDVARRMAAEEAARRAAEERERELSALANQLMRQTVELEHRRRQAEEAQKRADEANRVKSQFLAAMSHELRTPLNAIGGYADLLLMELAGPVTPLQLEHLTRIKRSRDHLLGIINDILNFTRVEAGKLTYDLGPVPINEVIVAVMHMIAPQAHAKKIAFEALGCSRDLVALADRAKVEQIVLNLVSNAVKFTASGGCVTLRCERLDAGRGALMVRDTGCGIPDDQLQVIFEPFVQVGRTLTTALEGTGLGLAISRDLARAMRGDIVVESTVNAGSTFTLTLPLDE